MTPRQIELRKESIRIMQGFADRATDPRLIEIYQGEADRLSAELHQITRPEFSIYIGADGMEHGEY